VTWIHIWTRFCYQKATSRKAISLSTQGLGGDKGNQLLACDILSTPTQRLVHFSYFTLSNFLHNFSDSFYLMLRELRYLIYLISLRHFQRSGTSENIKGVAGSIVARAVCVSILFSVSPGKAMENHSKLQNSADVPIETRHRPVDLLTWSYSARYFHVNRPATFPLHYAQCQTAPTICFSIQMAAWPPRIVLLHPLWFS
jgi:hypothetical protein